MTREEEINNASYAQFCNSSSVTFTLQKEAFEAGAKWADNNLSQNVINLEKIWHTMEELPEINTDICVQWKYGDILSFYYENFFYDGMVEYADRIERWAYIKDLLPKEGKK